MSVKLSGDRKKTFNSSFYCFNLRDALIPHKSTYWKDYYYDLVKLLEYNNYVLDVSDGTIEKLNDNSIKLLVNSNIEFFNIKKKDREYYVTNLCDFDISYRSINLRGVVTYKIISSTLFNFTLSYVHIEFCKPDNKSKDYTIRLRSSGIDIILCCVRISGYIEGQHRENCEVRFFKSNSNKDIIELYFVFGEDLHKIVRFGVLAFNIKTYRIIHAFAYGKNVSCTSRYVDKSIHADVLKFLLLL